MAEWPAGSMSVRWESVMKQQRERIVSEAGLRPVISRSSQIRGAVLRVRAIGGTVGSWVISGVVRGWGLVVGRWAWSWDGWGGRWLGDCLVYRMERMWIVPRRCS